MGLIKRTYTTGAYWPRTGHFSVFERNARLDIVYNVWSSGEPSSLPASDRLNLFFVHGAQMHKEIWNYYVELCFKQWGPVLDKVVALDAATHGDSALLNAHKASFYSSWADLGRDIGMVTRDCITRGDVAGPVILLGHSMGGAGTLFASVFDPELYAGAFVMDPVWGGDEDNDVEPYNQFIGHLGGRAYKNSRADFASPEDYATFLRKAFSRTFHPRIKSDWDAGNVYTDPSGQLHSKQTRPLQGGSYISAMSTNRAGNSIFRYIQMPIVVVTGDIEDWNPPGSSKLLVETVPDSALLEIVGGGHLIAFEKPDEVFSAMVPYINDIYKRELELRKKWVGTDPPFDKVEAIQEQQLQAEFELLKTGKRSKVNKL